MTEPRLLAGLVADVPMGLADHQAMHGGLPPSDGLLADVEAAGLRGRGGAAFPTAVKLATTANGRRPVVVVNGAEGEPMSAKDRVLLTRIPHLVLDGALVSAQAIGAREIVVAAPRGMLPGLGSAVRERRGSDSGRVRWRLDESPDTFVGGEETALLAHLEGRPALPRTRPPMPAQRGLRGRPTLVQNAETLAQVALIARYGPAWFREVGTPEHPGTTLVSLSGAVAEPGVYEVPLGFPIAGLAALAGGALEPIRALLVGGYFGAWIDGDGEGLTLDNASLGHFDAAVGAGVVVLLGASACPVAEVAALADWLSDASAGQCGPCVHGLAALSDLLQRVESGQTVPGDSTRLSRWTAMVRGRGACGHPDGAARMLASASRVFARELADHARRGHSPSCRIVPTLHLPRAEHEGGVSEKLSVDPIRCTGHGLCAELLPEWIALDDWGYPMIDQRPVAPGAARACAQRRADVPGTGAAPDAGRPALVERLCVNDKHDDERLVVGSSPLRLATRRRAGRGRDGQSAPAGLELCPTQNPKLQA